MSDPYFSSGAAALALSFCALATVACGEDATSSGNRPCEVAADCAAGEVCSDGFCASDEGVSPDPSPTPSPEVNNGELCGGLTCPAPPLGASMTCVDDACLAVCTGARVDLDGDLQDPGGTGCECAPSGAEVCDGRDNDCDGLADFDDEDFVRPACSLNVGVCDGTPARCEDDAPQRCEEGDFAAHALEQGQVFTGLPESLELLCDRQDNNCDGRDDENCCDLGEGRFVVESGPLTLHAVAVATTEGGVGPIAVAYSNDAATARVATLSVRGDRLGDVQQPRFLFAEPLRDEPGPVALAWDGEAFFMAWTEASPGQSGTVDEVVLIQSIDAGGAATGPELEVAAARGLDDPEARAAFFSLAAAADPLTGLRFVALTTDKCGLEGPCVKVQAFSADVRAREAALEIGSVPGGPLGPPALALGEEGLLVAWIQGEGERAALTYSLRSPDDLAENEGGRGVLEAAGAQPTGVAAASVAGRSLLAVARGEGEGATIEIFEVGQEGATPLRTLELAGADAPVEGMSMSARSGRVYLGWREGDALRAASFDPSSDGAAERFETLEGGQMVGEVGAGRAQALAAVESVGTAVAQRLGDGVAVGVLNDEGDALCLP